jgi:hypothetical protein
MRKVRNPPVFGITLEPLKVGGKVTCCAKARKVIDLPGDEGAAAVVELTRLTRKPQPGTGIVQFVDVMPLPKGWKGPRNTALIRIGKGLGRRFELGGIVPIPSYELPLEEIGIEPKPQRVRLIFPSGAGYGIAQTGIQVPLPDPDIVPKNPKKK